MEAKKRKKEKKSGGGAQLSLPIQLMLAVFDTQKKSKTSILKLHLC